MDKKQLQAAVDYINDNAAALHDVKENKLDVGNDITVDDVISSRVVGADVVLIANRGIKGSPKYRIPAADIEAHKSKPAPVEKKAEAPAKK